MSAFLQGVLAGYGIAIPVGAIAILIIERGLRQGFWSGFAAGCGAATADLCYALLAALAGQVLAAALLPVSQGLRWGSAAVLIGLGVWGIWRTLRSQPTDGVAQTARMGNDNWQTYLQFVGLTLLNPLTIVYFAALILGGSAELSDWLGRGLFVLGAALASFSWQSVLAALGAVGHSRLSPNLQAMISLAGNLIVAGLGVRMLFLA